MTVAQKALLTYTGRAFYEHMKVSLNWLKDFIEFDKKYSIEEIAWKLTEATAEIEQVHHIGAGLEHVVVGEIVETKKHPDADKLFVGKVKVSPKESIQVIYGQKAVVKVGDRVPTAIAPVQLQGGKVERGKIRGVLSEGMLCLDSELIEGAPECLTKFGKSAKVGIPITKVLPLEDIVLEIDNHSITHRPDLFSHYGFARECVALGLAKWKKQLKSKNVEKMTGNKEMPVSPAFESKSCSKNYYSTIISGISTQESPSWVKARLEAVGMRSINAIVDITNLVMLEIGQPVHAFDLRLIKGKKFIHRLSKKGEQLTTLDGMKRTLDDDVIIIQSGEDIVDLCGIMGAENSAVKDDTTEIYLHCCHYDNVLIRKAMISLGHRTDAGTIFEKNIEPERAQVGFIRCLELFKSLFPKAGFEYKTFHYQQEESPKRSIKLPFEKMKSHLGIEIDSKKVEKYLQALGFGVKATKSSLTVQVPSWRSNSITIPEDIIEEIVRIHGYSNVPANPPEVELATPVKNHKRHSRRTIQSFLTGQGFQEEANYSFLSEGLLAKVGISDHSDLIELANPVSEDFRYMRPNFLPYLLSNLGRNQIFSPQEWKTFEMGAVYKRLEQEVVEYHLLTMLISSPDGKDTFLQAKEITKSLFHELALDFELRDAEYDLAFPQRCLSILSEEHIIGHIYELHPMLQENFKIKGATSIVEINLDELYLLDPREIYYQQINRNPQALLDINVVVDSGTAMAKISQIIQSVAPEYLKSSELVDLYEGKNLGEGKKSFTFALSYQHPERTLEEKEIQEILEKLITALEKEGGVVRR